MGRLVTNIVISHVRYGSKCVPRVSTLVFLLVPDIVPCLIRVPALAPFIGRRKTVRMMKKRRRGRPCIYSRMIGAALVESIANGASRRRACIEAGVAYSSFMRWQASMKSIRARVERAAGMFQEKHLREDAE